MVYFKITDGEVTRKFKVNPGDITYDQLKERIATLFPKNRESSQKLILRYRDNDGDVITISTNDEFQEALLEMPSEYVWKLHIHNSKPRERQASRTAMPSNFFFQPSHGLLEGLFSRPYAWSGFGRRFSSPRLSNPWTTLDWEFDRMLDQHTQLLNATHNSGEEATTSSAAADSSTPDTAGLAASQSAGGDVANCVPGLQVKNFGLWEPREFQSPFGTGKIIGPVGYYISWCSSPGTNEKEDKSASAPEGEGADKKDNSASAPDGEGADKKEHNSAVEEVKGAEGKETDQQQ